MIEDKTRVYLKQNYSSVQICRDEKGYSVIQEGPVIIEGCQHYVRDGYVSCNPSLNQKAWNVTPLLGRCGECYKHFDHQLKLF